MELVFKRSLNEPLPQAQRPAQPPLSDPRANQILAAMDRDAYQRLSSTIVPVDLPLGHVIWESGSRLENAYFPTTGVVSLLNTLASGASSEIAVVGNEGMLGVSLLMGGATTLNRAVVRCAGRGFRLRSSDLMREFGRAGPANQVVLRYTMSLLTQVAQVAACNRYHVLPQQLCRLLLLTLDGQDGEELTLTQEAIAGALGVRREGVTEAAVALQKAGLIRYARGHILVLNRQGLEQRACECYRVIKAEYARLSRSNSPLGGHRDAAPKRS